jgi:predicted solute-binding protein
MTLFIDKSLITTPIWAPIQEKWIETDLDVEIREGLTAGDVGTGDVALIPGPQTPGLARTHFIDPSIAIVTEAISPIAMRTPVRPDDVEETPIRMLETGPTAEVLLRALLRPYFGITASTFVTDAEDPAVADAQVVVVDGVLGLMEPESGFQEDLTKAWFVLTGASVVHAVTIVGVEAEARGAGPELDLLRAAAAIGYERRRDVRRMISEGEELDHGRLVEMTNRMRFEMTSEDRQSLRNLLARGTWGTTYGRVLPAFRDEVEGADA